MQEPLPPGDGDRALLRDAGHLAGNRHTDLSAHDCRHDGVCRDPTHRRGVCGWGCSCRVSAGPVVLLSRDQLPRSGEVTLDQHHVAAVRCGARLGRPRGDDHASRRPRDSRDRHGHRPTLEGLPDWESRSTSRFSTNTPARDKNASEGTTAGRGISSRRGRDTPPPPRTPRGGHG